MRVPKFLFGLSVLGLLDLTTALIIPSRTETVNLLRVAPVLPPGLVSKPTPISQRLRPRATNSFNFVGFDPGQLLILQAAIRDAAWLGQMAEQSLANVNSINDLPQAYQTYFEHGFTPGRFSIIQGIVKEQGKSRSC
jgi:hypothetical protein